MSNAGGEVDARFHKMIMRLAPAERLAMACRMFDAGRTLVVAGLLSRERDLTGVRLKRALLERFYARDLDPEHFSRIEADLERPDRHKRTDADGAASG